MHPGLFQKPRLHEIGPLHCGLQVPHLSAEIDGINLEDISIGILVGHRPGRRDEHRHIHDRDLGKIPIKVEDDQQSLRGHANQT